MKHLSFGVLVGMLGAVVTFSMTGSLGLAFAAYSLIGALGVLGSDVLD